MADVDTTRLVAVVVGVVLITSVVGAALVGGYVDPLLDDGPEASTPAATTTTAASGQAGGGDAGGGSTGDSNGGDSDASSGDGDTSTPRPHVFRFSIVGTEKCGSTCRDVTIRLTNDGSETAENVQATSRILVKGDELWSASEDIGSVAAGESVTRTKRVNLGFVDAAKIQRNGGYVTIETTITWDGGSRTFTQRQKVT